MTEHQTVEFKESWRDEYLRWLYGFANAEGGKLVIGRDDNGRAIGVADARRLLEEIPNKARDLLGIVPLVRLIEESGRQLVEIEVEPSPTAISYRGEYHVRSGSTKQELRGPALTAFLLRKMGRHWDAAPVPGVGVNDLDARAMRSFVKRALRWGRIAPEAEQASDEELLERLHLTDNAFLKRAAIMLFHPDPLRFVSGAFVKIGFFATKADVLYHDVIEGDLFAQAAKTLDLLTTKYMKAWISYEGAHRLEPLPVPEPALREAVFNAIVHKDYGVAAPVQIKVFDDHLTIWNPGQLPNAWPPEHLKEAHPSLPPNPDIAAAFFRTGMIETWGRGIEKMLQACRDAAVPEPVFSTDGHGLWTEFGFVRLPAAAGARQVTGQVAGQIAPPLTPPLTPPVAPPLDPPVAALLRLLADMGPLGNAELRAQLKLKDRRHVRERYVTPALADGFVELTIPDKPSSRFQKYRLTPAGKAALEAAKMT